VDHAFDLKDDVVLDPSAAAQIRDRLGIPDGRAPKLAFHAGPGDAVGTFEQWAEGRHDARVPVLTYSAQFYSLVAALGAEALVLTESESRPTVADPRFRFVCVKREGSAKGIRWHLAERDYARRLAAAVSDWAPDVTILGGDLKPAAYHALAGRGQLILSLHNTFWPMGNRPQTLKSRARQWLLGRALARAKGAVCTSAECARQLETLAGDVQRVETEMPQVRPEHLHTPRARKRARQLLFLGRIEANKGVFDLLEAFGALARRFEDARLVLAGSGSADEALRDAVSHQDAAAQIEFAGSLDADGVHDALRESDLLVCPTRTEFNEGLALVVLEAAAQGMPSVASSVVPAAETVGAACVTFSADDVAALRGELEKIMEDDEAYTRLARNAGPIRAKMLDRSLGWSSCLARVIAA
jgi:glycosyltransferase involved in cell wall biosynthesis